MSRLEFTKKAVDRRKTFKRDTAGPMLHAKQHPQKITVPTVATIQPHSAASKTKKTSSSLPVDLLAATATPHKFSRSSQNLSLPMPPTTSRSSKPRAPSRGTSARISLRPPVASSAHSGTNKHPTTRGAPSTSLQTCSQSDNQFVAPASSVPQQYPRSFISGACNSSAVHTTATTSTAATNLIASLAGARYEPNEYKIGFTFKGEYSCLESAPATASLWAGNGNDGNLDVYSCVTGQLTISLPPRVASFAFLPPARAKGFTTPKSVKPAMLLSPSPQATSRVFPKPRALKATPTHMWVGYDNGNVAVYDLLVLECVTEGCFHNAPVIAFCVFSNGTVVSAFEDGVLVHWYGEESNFEAIKRLTTLKEEKEGALTCVAAAPAHHQPSAVAPGKSAEMDGHDLYRSEGHYCSTVLCGLESGAIFVVDLISAQVINTFKGHTQRINSLIVIGELIFSASEDSSVCVWSGSQLKMGVFGGKHSHFNRLVKRISVSPPVRALLADFSTSSVWVAYTNGLLERWSANADDDFGIEEMIEEGMQLGGQRKEERINSTDAQASSADESDAPEGQQVVALFAVGAVETLQILALASNGVNKVWYSHWNVLEENMSAAIRSLSVVVSEDTRDTEAWQERLSKLKQQERDCKQNYILILKYLSDKKLQLRYFESWRLFGLRSAVLMNKETATRNFGYCVRHQLRRNYFTKWATFYDRQKWRIRRHCLVRALEEATYRLHAASALQRWQAGAARQRLRRFSVRCAEVIAHASGAPLLCGYFFKWRSFFHMRASRRGVATGLAPSRPLSHEQMGLLAYKVREQTLRSALRKWMNFGLQHTSPHTRGATALDRYMKVFAKLQQMRYCRAVLYGWRKLCLWKRKQAIAHAEAAFQERQRMLQLQERYLLQWIDLVCARRLECRRKEIQEVEVQLRRAEKAYGDDIFEKLQLQKRIDRLIHQQDQGEWELRGHRQRLQQLQDNGESLCQREAEFVRENSDLLRDLNAGGDGSRVSQSSLIMLPSIAGAAVPAAGPMSVNATQFRCLIEQQRLSPVVLTHLPLPDAMYHIMTQFKGCLLNMYTDLPLFRQVRERQSAGITPAAIFLESFNEIKRLVMTILKSPYISHLTPAALAARAAYMTSTNQKAGAAGANRGFNAEDSLLTSFFPSPSRWPLCMEALDSIPVHLCSSVLSAVKTMVVAYDLLSSDDTEKVVATCEEVMYNADWIFLIARACYMRRRPVLPVNNRLYEGSECVKVTKPL